MRVKRIAALGFVCAAAAAIAAVVVLSATAGPSPPPSGPPPGEPGPPPEEISNVTPPPEVLEQLKEEDEARAAWQEFKRTGKLPLGWVASFQPEAYAPYTDGFIVVRDCVPASIAGRDICLSMRDGYISMGASPLVEPFGDPASYKWWREYKYYFDSTLGLCHEGFCKEQSVTGGDWAWELELQSRARSLVKWMDYEGGQVELLEWRVVPEDEAALAYLRAAFEAAGVEVPPAR